MPDNEHSFPIVGDSEILAVKHLPLEVIPQLIKRFDDGLKSEAKIVREKPFNVFKQ